MVRKNRYKYTTTTLTINPNNIKYFVITAIEYYSSKTIYLLFYTKCVCKINASKQYLNKQANTLKSEASTIIVNTMR